MITHHPPHVKSSLWITCGKLDHEQRQRPKNKNPSRLFVFKNPKSGA
nr:MAG TPA: hypothetical protein [Caudoviricetes sp.]